MRDKVVGWSAEITRLAKFAQVQPHAAYSALTHGLSSHWLYLCRTTPNISEALQPLEDNIRLVLIPTLMGCSPPNDTIRKLFALPPRYGGLGIINPTLIAAEEYSASCHIAEPLSQFILDQLLLQLRSIQPRVTLLSLFHNSFWTGVSIRLLLKQNSYLASPQSAIPNLPTIRIDLPVCVPT